MINFKKIVLEVATAAPAAPAAPAASAAPAAPAASAAENSPKPLNDKQDKINQQLLKGVLEKPIADIQKEANAGNPKAAFLIKVLTEMGNTIPPNILKTLFGNLDVGKAAASIAGGITSGNK